MKTKTMWRSRVMVLAVTAAVLASATAWGGAAASAATTAATSGRVQLVMWGSWSGSQITQLDQELSAFNKSQNGITVTYQLVQDAETKLLTATVTGESPDLILWDRNLTAKFAGRDILQPLNSFINAAHVNLNAFYQAPLNEMRINGVQYGLPLISDARVLFYNKKLFAAANLQPPTNWAQLASDAKALTVHNSAGQLTQAGMVIDPGTFTTWIQQAGGWVLNKAGTATAFNSPAGHEVLSFWNQLLNVDKVYQVGFGQGGNPFAEGKVAMQYDGPWDVQGYNQIPGLSYGVVQPPVGPTGNKGAITGGFGLIIPKASKHQQAAWQFVKWMTTNTANQVALAKITGWIPALKAAAANPYFAADPAFGPIAQTIQYARSRPTVPGYADLEQLALTPQLQNWMSGKESANQALSTAAQQGNQILAQGGAE